MTDLMKRLRMLSAMVTDDLSIADDAVDELQRLQRAIELKDAALTQAMADLSKLRVFARSLLDPELFGHAVSVEIRNAARRALGLPATETTRLPAQSFNEADVKRDALTWPCGSLGEDVTHEGSPR